MLWYFDAHWKQVISRGEVWGFTLFFIFIFFEVLLSPSFKAWTESGSVQHDWKNKHEVFHFGVWEKEAVLKESTLHKTSHTVAWAWVFWHTYLEIVTRANLWLSRVQTKCQAASGQVMYQVHGTDCQSNVLFWGVGCGCPMPVCPPVSICPANSVLQLMLTSLQCKLGLAEGTGAGL